MFNFKSDYVTLNGYGHAQVQLQLRCGIYNEISLRIRRHSFSNESGYTTMKPVKLFQNRDREATLQLMGEMIASLESNSDYSWHSCRDHLKKMAKTTEKQLFRKQLQEEEQNESHHLTLIG